MDEEHQQSVRKAMLEHLSNNDKVCFVSPGEDQAGLSFEQKLDIANDLLNRSCGLFLAKFGKYLLQEHLCYFENINDEERGIINIYLEQLNKIYQKRSLTITVDEENRDCVKMEVTNQPENEDLSKITLRNQLLDHLASSNRAHFRSQQVGEPDLSAEEKKTIAGALLDRSSELFLAKFGSHLLEKHLCYFDNSDNYEVNYHLSHLKQTKHKGVSEVRTKNRRFAALKKMVDEGSYFCETEMRNRNPLLYEQLVGRFLTPEERKIRLNNNDTSNITFSNILLNHIDQEAVQLLKQEQEEAEDMVEEDSSDEEQMETEDEDSEDDNDLDKTLWGESYSDCKTSAAKCKSAKQEKKTETVKRNIVDEELSDEEKELLMDEFRTSVFSTFLQGNDENFDYRDVDENSDYDDLEAQTQDAEEKYFDEEVSEDATISSNMSDEETH